MKNQIKITPVENGFIVEVPNNTNFASDILESLLEIAAEQIGLEINMPKGAFSSLPTLPVAPQIFVFKEFLEVQAFLQKLFTGELDLTEENEVPQTSGE